MKIFLPKLFLIHYVLQNATFHAYHFNKCDSSSNSNVLDTLNGQIKGECLKVPISYANGSKISTNVLNWLSVPYAEPPINENRFKNPLSKKAFGLSSHKCAFWNYTRLKNSGSRIYCFDCKLLGLLFFCYRFLINI